MPPSYLLSLLGRIALERHECSQHAEISLAWPLMSKDETFFVDFKAEIALVYKWHTWQNAVIEWRTVSSADFRNSINVSNSLDPDQARLLVGPDLGPTCSQGLSAAELGPHCLPTLYAADDWSRLLFQKHFFRWRFKGQRNLNKIKKIWHRYTTFKNKYSTDGGSRHTAQIQTEINFCSILDLEAGRLKSSIHVVS